MERGRRGARERECVRQIDRERDLPCVLAAGGAVHIAHGGCQKALLWDKLTFLICTKIRRISAISRTNQATA